MSAKLKFVEAATRPGANISELCREQGISRQTGHKWLKRYRDDGYLGLAEYSRRPHSSPAISGEEVVAAVLELRDHHPSWGPKKIADVLAPRFGEDGPRHTTVARLLKRFGLVRKRRPSVRVWNVAGKPCVEVKAPNDLWTIDFKGWWLAGNGQRCEPLTVRDAFSRFVLAVTVVSSTRGTVVRKILQALFAKYGRPKAILADNGSPWISSRARGGLTRMSAWLVSLGIQLHRSRPGRPQDNGGHERMHRDLSELELRPARSRRGQQPLCDRWVLDFNHIRPHEALAGKTPAEVYVVTEQTPADVRVPIYPAGWLTRRVMSSGEITIDGDRVSIGRPLVGQLIALHLENGLRWRARFFDVDLGTIELAPSPLLLNPLPDAVNPNNGGPPMTVVSA